MVPLGFQGEVQKLRFKNKGNKVKKFKLFSFVEWCLWNALDDMTNFQRNFSTGEVEIDGSVLYHKTEYKERRNHFAFYSVNAEIKGFDTDRESFLGLYNGFDSPQVIENGAAFNGSPMGPLETLDSISLETAYHATRQRRADAEAAGDTWEPTPESEVIRIMVEEARRVGQAAGAGFYDYDDKGRKVKTWDGLRCLFAPDGYVDIPFEDVKDRLLFPQVLEAIRIMEEGVLTSVGDGNIGSIMGIGFPPHTGGVYQCVNAYGLQAFADRATELANKYGEAFKPPALLLEMAAGGRTFA